MRRDAIRRPALQHLPFAAEAITIDLVGADRDGRPVLDVRYATSLRAARAAYRRWLAYWRDHPSAYRARFRALAHDPTD
jgi:hypothetical protein